MKTRTIGKDQVGAIGLGCMGMSWLYGTSDPVECHQVLERALELGCNHWDTADVYGAGGNEELIGPIVQKHRDKVFLATKFGNVYDRTLTSHQDQVTANAPHIVDGSPRYLRAQCEASLKRLGIDHIDLYYQHRIDLETPIEETWGELSRLVEEGKVRYLGISEAAASTIRRAHAVHPVVAAQLEYSLWTRDPESNGQKETLDELGIALVAYSPLGRGFLTGRFESLSDLEEGDYRHNNPRFQGEAFELNQNLANAVKAVASRKGTSPARIALAWVLAQGDNVLPIPGTKRLKYLEDNLGALEVELTPDDLQELANIGAAAGPRYPEMFMQFSNR